MSDTPLTNHPCDDGGVLCELYREQEYGQLNMRTIPVGVTAGEHIHPNTDEWWLVVRGTAKITLRWQDGKQMIGKWIRGYDCETFDVPSNTWHKIENVGSEEVVLIYWASQVYDPDNPDKETIWPTS